MKLYDVKEQETFGLFVLIKSVDVRTSRLNQPFLAFVFQDMSGTMEGMYWSASAEDIAQFQAGRVVFLRGQRDTYNGKPQIKIMQLRLADAGEPNDPTLYVEHIDMKRDDIERQLNDALLEIHEPHIARVVRKILAQAGDDFYAYPAAKRHHHALAGGLSFHTISMLQIARQLIKQYPELNASLLLGGILLHDIAKTMELSGPISTEYTLKGKLLGHIVLMDEWIDRVSRELGFDPDIEPILLLKHVVLAHHGKLEYGSPIAPQIMEAEVLHHIDNLDARLNMMSQALNKVEAGQYSEPIFALERRQLYKPSFKK